MPKQNVVRFQDDWNGNRIIEIDGCKESVSFLSFLDGEEFTAMCVELNKESLKDFIDVLNNHYSKMV